MKTSLQKLILLVMLFIAKSNIVHSQNWQYVGSPYINQTTSMFDYIYFADLEFNSSGDAFIGYWMYSQQLKFAKYSAGTWTQLASPGTYAVNNVDIEIKDNNYYMAYSGVRGANMYVFVKKFDGTVWNMLGDSMLLGNSGSGGHFDFLLDNNEVPTVLGVVSTPLLGEKQVMQFNGTSWVNYFTFSGSAATIFGESSSIFDSQNVLYCNTQGYVTIPTVSYYNVTHKIDAGVRTTVGDTLFGATGAHVLKFDAGGVPHLCFNNVILSKTLAYKLTGNNWVFIADTSGANLGTLLNADLSSNGKFVFNTQGAVLTKSIYIYDGNQRLSMDSLNIQGTALGSITDLVIPKNSTDVYALALEIKSNGAQDLSVLKHTIVGSNGILKLSNSNEFQVYPNPSNGMIIISSENLKDKTWVEIYDNIGKLIYTEKITQTQQSIDIGHVYKGIYLVKYFNADIQAQQKIIIE
ncbi:MAG TPA: T9SS type A sorting domain-containing protein [Bacteroidia bacterium]|nr:T9SS type A sorting domain-containing protein [Bacteroidia bacterium]